MSSRALLLAAAARPVELSCSAEAAMETVGEGLLELAGGRPLPGLT